LSTSFTLKGESSLWLILRTDDSFDEFSAVIRISKEDKSQNMFISMGTFVKDVHKNLVFKIFSKQQLIDFSSKNIYNDNHLELKTKSYKESDSCDVRAYILDTGDDKIIAKIIINDSKMENNISSEFFLPFFDRNGRVMIAGSGQQCCVRTFICKCNLKFNKIDCVEDKNTAGIFTNEKRNCDCCLIF
jgi:hypothetical protein